VGRTYLAGTGLTRFGKFADASLASLGRSAALEAVRDAGIEPQQVQMIACGSARSGILQNHESGVGQRIGWEIGIEGVPVYNEKAYCASGAVAFNLANICVASGEHDVALVVGVEKMSGRDGKGRPLTSDGVMLESEVGFTPPAYYAMAAQRHMSTYGTTRRQIAGVAVKNRRAAHSNTKAQYREPISIDEVLSAPQVAGPLGLLDCCPTGDGASAAVIVSAEGAQRLGISPTIEITASVIGSGLYCHEQRDLTSFALDKSVSLRAYERAGVAPHDIDVAEVHDSFSIAEIIHYEDLGFCQAGMGGSLIDSGATALGGQIPVNAGGGLLNRGHPLGATGVAQIAELADQLRGRSGDRQVAGARLGLAHISGGFMGLDFATSGVTILEARQSG